MMNITVLLVYMLEEMSPEVYGPYVVYENGHILLYVQVLKALYGIMGAFMLCYKQFRSDILK